MLVAAMNPCPCGYLGDPRHRCGCNPRQVQSYRARISGPLLDRIDIHVDAPAISLEQLRAHAPGESSSAMRERVMAARGRQHNRFAKDSATISSNARMLPRHLRQHCRVPPAVEDHLQAAMRRLNLSARAYDRILKVARTIADLDDANDIALHHLNEAIHYRSLDRT
jgi:magnesium chelatase family protein